MEPEVKLSDTAQEYWDYVMKLNQITAKLLRDKENLRDPNESEMRTIFNIQKLIPIQDEDND